MTSRVRVRVPATSANLGPGFDALGLALELWDDIEAEADFDGSGQSLSVEVEGVGSESVPRDERHLVVAAMRAAFTEAGTQPSMLRLSCRNVLPHSRGLGSSAAAIVAGVLAGQALAGVEPDRSSSSLQLATRLEGHPDNVAPCLLGGLTIAWTGARSRVRATRVEVHPGITPVVCIPPGEVSTELARGLLPDTVSHHDAATNAARAALLVEALSHRPDLLLDATEDRLHQRYREPAMPETIALVAALREQGLAAVVSGAGPSVLVLAGPGQEAGVSAQAGGWDVRSLHVSTGGAVVEALTDTGG